MPSLRRFVGRYTGFGPYHIRPVTDIAALRMDQRKGVHQPERFDGILASYDGDIAAYSSGHSLLGHPETYEQIGDSSRYRKTGITPLHQKILFSLSDAAVVGTDGIVYCPKMRAAALESMRTWTTSVDRHPVLAAPRLPRPTRLEGRCLTIALLSAEGFYHFLVEALPRLWLAQKCLPPPFCVLANGHPGSIQEKWLHAAGVAPERIFWMNGLTNYVCDQLVFTNYLMGEHQPTAWIVNAIRDLLNVTPASLSLGNRRIWISRGDAESRQPLWESDLLDRLGVFEVVHLSRLEPSEQIAIMREASVVAGPHGAGLSNIIFCAPGTKIVELRPSTARRPIYSRLANVCGLPYAWAEVDFSTAFVPDQLAPSISSFISG